MRARDRLAWVVRMADKHFPSRDGLVSAELVLKRCEFALEQAQSKRKVLVEYTKPKTLKELRSAVEKARSDELAKQAAWELEKAKGTKLGRQNGRPRRILDSTRI